MKSIQLPLYLTFFMSLSANTTAEQSNIFRKYFCENGFYLENNGNKHHCIQPAKISYRALDNCNYKPAETRNYYLEIDQKGNEDLCVQKIINSEQSFKPNCQHGYSLKIRRGKDACIKLKPKIIIAPLIKLSQKNKH